MAHPDAQAPPSKLQLALQQAVQDLVDRTGRPPHELAQALEDLLRQGCFDMPSQAPEDARPPIVRSFDRSRSFVKRYKNIKLTIERAAPCGQAVDERNARQWAEDAARRLDDVENVLCYEALARRHARDLLDRTLVDVLAVPAARIRKSRGALFVALVAARTRSRHNQRQASKRLGSDRQKGGLRLES